MEKLRLSERRLFKVVQPSWWRSRVGTQVCPFAPSPYLKDSCPSLGAGPGSREEARGRESQEFELGELVGGGWEVWEWPVVRTWATRCSVKLHWVERGRQAGTGLLSQRCLRVSRGGIWKVALSWGQGKHPRVVHQRVELGTEAPPRTMGI